MRSTIFAVLASAALVSAITSTTAPATLNARQTTATTSLQCSTTSIKPTTACSVSAGKTLSCSSTDATVVSCATGLICFPAIGNEAAPCMRRDNHLTLSGLIVTIVFGVALTGTLIAFIILHFRAAKQAKNDALRVAMMKTQESAMSSARPRAETGSSFTGAGKRNVSDANLPLIKPGGDRSEQSYANAPDYFAEESGASGQAPQIHPGLGALGQERY